MTIRNLEFLFKPSSVALIGASPREASVGHMLALNLLTSPFAGEVWLVNLKHRTLLGRKVYQKIEQLPATPELAIISTPPHTLPDLIRQLGEKGTRAAIVISAGFAEMGEKGEQLQQAMMNAAKPYLLRILGPNCVGMMMPLIGLNASFAHLSPALGRVAFVTQSGAVITGVLDWAQGRGIGFSSLVSLGAGADIDFADMLDYLANDNGTDAILLYVEGIQHARKFMSAARAAARMKPVIVVKAGRHAASAVAAKSHTGALAGNDAVYDAAIRRAGMIRVDGLNDLFGAAEILSRVRKLRGERVAILTNGGGFGVIATDHLLKLGGQLAELNHETIKSLSKVLPSIWSGGNPVDIIGDAGAQRYRDALNILFTEPGVDIVLLLNCPTAIANSTNIARMLVDMEHLHSHPHLITVFVGDATVREARRLCTTHGIPCYDTPEEAVRSIMHLVAYTRNQRTLMETPPSVPSGFEPDTAAASDLIDQVLKDKRSWLNQAEARSLLASYGIPIAETHHVATPDDAARCAQQLACPVALKIDSQDFVHKSDVGGVALQVDPAMVAPLATDMLERIRCAISDARIDGFYIEPMITRPGALELLIGVTVDPVFGPVVLFGHGGTATEQIDDVAIGLPPLNLNLANEIMKRTQINRLLHGYRNQAAVNLTALKKTLVQVSQLVADFPEIQEMDINPLLVDADGVIVLDARIRIEASSQDAQQRLAIRPYPSELEESLTLADGRVMWLRPIRPEDEPALVDAFKTLTPAEIRLRFQLPMSTLNHVMAARFTQLDYDRDMALVLSDQKSPGQSPIHGVVRIHADPDNESAEFAIIVHHELTGLGLGIYMMQRIIDYARKRGLHEIHGQVLRENRSMREICRELGFTQESNGQEPGIVRVVLAL